MHINSTLLSFIEDESQPRMDPPASLLEREKLKKKIQELEERILKIEKDIGKKKGNETELESLGRT